MPLNQPTLPSLFTTGLMLYVLIGCSHTSPAPDIHLPESTQETSGLCPLKSSAPQTWSVCDGQKVTFVGVPPKMVLAHPNAGGIATKQSYLEVANKQIVVSSSSVPECSGTRIVTGILHRVDLGGAAGTRSSYQGWSLTQAVIVCQ